MRRQAVRALLLALTAIAVAAAQTGARRLTTIDALRQFPGFYHLQNVLVRGEFATEGARTMLRADENEIRAVFDEGASPGKGVVDARAVLIDVGRLEPSDPRAGAAAEGRDAEKWPRPGEELVLRVTATVDTPAASGATVRTLAIEPWRYDGQTVTVIGNFRGRNLFGDLPGAPGKSKYDFVLRGTEGAVWVTDIRPRGQGFDLDINRRVDTDRWLEVTGTVGREKGLVTVKATRVSLAKAPQLAVSEEPTAPAVPLLPIEVVFNTPTDGETDVSGTTPIRIQFSRGVNESTLAGQIRLSYVGRDDAEIQFKTSYDAANRAIQLIVAQPLEPFRTVRVELMDGIKAFDGAPFKGWSITFSVGG